MPQRVFGKVRRQHCALNTILPVTGKAIWRRLTAIRHQVERPMKVDPYWLHRLANNKQADQPRPLNVLWRASPARIAGKIGFASLRGGDHRGRP